MVGFPLSLLSSIILQYIYIYYNINTTILENMSGLSPTPLQTVPIPWPLPGGGGPGIRGGPWYQEAGYDVSGLGTA